MVGAVKPGASDAHVQPADTTPYKVQNGDNLWDIAKAQVQNHDNKLTGQALNTATANYLEKLEGDNTWLADRPGGYNMIYGPGSGPGPHHPQDTIYLPDWPSSRRASQPPQAAPTKTIQRTIESAIKGRTLSTTLNRYANPTDYSHTLSAVKAIVGYELGHGASPSQVGALIRPYLNSLSKSKISAADQGAAALALEEQIFKENHENIREFDARSGALRKEYGFDG